MDDPLPRVYLVRHGETQWSRDRRHTGRTDLPLTAQGEAQARSLGERLRGQQFALVLASPLQRALRTCELAGFGAVAQSDADLVEWDYGQYEGMRSSEIRSRDPRWLLFRDGCPGGESPAQVAERADRVVARVRAVNGAALLFSSAHLLRALAARWLGLDVAGGALLRLDTACLSVLGYEHDRSEPVVQLWNAP
jgi:probable phosphoglycerate mutase